jgi:hypothetical protein
MPNYSGVHLLWWDIHCITWFECMCHVLVALDWRILTIVSHLATVAELQQAINAVQPIHVSSGSHGNCASDSVIAGSSVLAPIQWSRNIMLLMRKILFIKIVLACGVWSLSAQVFGRRWIGILTITAVLIVFIISAIIGKVPGEISDWNPRFSPESASFALFAGHIPPSN